MRKRGRNSLELLAKSHLLLGALLTVGISVPVEAATFTPILPLESSEKDLGNSGLEEALRDTVITKSAIHDDADAARVQGEIEQYVAEMRTAKGPRSLELHQMAFEATGVLLYFHLDQAKEKPESRGKLPALRSSFSEYARRLMAASKVPAAKARYNWHLIVTQFRNGGNRATAARSMAAIEKQIPRNLGSGARLVILLGGLHAGGKERQKALAELPGYASRLPIRAAVNLHLLVAKSASRKDYRPQLAAAVSKGSRLAEEEKNGVLVQATAIWRRQESGALQWDKPPFDMSRYGETTQYRAISERIALADLSKKNNAQALKRYRALTRTYEGKPQWAALETRVLDILQLDSAQSKNLQPYEAELIAAQAKAGEQQATAFVATLEARHKQLAERAFAEGSKPRATDVERRNSIRIVQNYLPLLKDESTKESWTERFGYLHATAGQHSKAVAIYMDLALNGKDPARKPRYYSAAIASQLELAQWPAEAPWSQTVNAGNAQTREALLDMYTKLSELQPQRWDLVAQAGLLQINLGRTEKAFGIWTAQLSKDARTSHSAHAAGYMLTSYQKAARWDLLESMSRLAIKTSMRPDHRGTVINAQETLALALLEGGKKLTADQQYAAAVKKLDEFIMNFRAHNRRDEGMLFLTEALRGTGDHTRSIEILTALVEQYPASKYLYAALLRGGDYSVPLAHEDAAMYFYQSFVMKFPKDKETERVRDNLVALYEGREMYAKAIALLKQRYDATHLTKERRSAAALEWMKMEDHHGSPARTLVVADTILNSPFTDTTAKTAAIETKATQLFSRRDVNGIATLQKYLASFDQSAWEVQEASGRMKYFQAELRASSLKYDENPLAIKNPLATLNQQYSIYWGAKQGYESVCAGGQSSACAPAMFKLARLSENYIEWLQDLKIVETLDAGTVKAFQDRKSAIMEGLVSIIETADNKALAVTAEGHGTPEWTDEVLWQNSADWNFDRVSGNTGNGYIQWRPTLTSVKRE